jgi:hypothetical protein
MYLLAIVLTFCILRAEPDAESFHIIKRHPLTDLGTDSCGLSPDGQVLACDYAGSPAGAERRVSSGEILRPAQNDKRVLLGGLIPIR